MKNPTTNAHNLYASIVAIMQGDAQDMLTTTKYLTNLYNIDPDWRDDAVNLALGVIEREAHDLLECGDEPDPMLHDVLSCIHEYYNT